MLVFIRFLRPWLQKFNNFYILFTVGFVVWMSFFDSNDIYSQIQMKKKIEKLETDKIYYQQQMQELTKEMKELQTSPDQLEKFAREKYRMKKPKEDVFILDKKE